MYNFTGVLPLSIIVPAANSPSMGTDFHIAVPAVQRSVKELFTLQSKKHIRALMYVHKFRDCLFPSFLECLGQNFLVQMTL